MKKLIPALCMLLISAALLGTSTYAWFSMNSSVTAEGMTITAQSDSVFLQIIKKNDGDTDTFSDTAAQTQATITYTGGAIPKLKPTHAVGAIADAGDGTVTVTDLTAGIKFPAMKFVEAFSAAPGDWKNANTGKYYDVTANATVGTSYTHLNNFQVRLNPTAGATKAYNLAVGEVNVTASSSDAMLSAVRVLVVCDKEWAIFDSTGTEVISSNNKVIAAEVGTDPTAVKVYMYFEGEDKNATTNQASLLAGAGYSVSLNFTVTAAP